MIFFLKNKHILTSYCPLMSSGFWVPDKGSKGTQVLELQLTNFNERSVVVIHIIFIWKSIGLHKGNKVRTYQQPSIAYVNIYIYFL